MPKRISTSDVPARFAADRSGATAVLFALLALPVLAIMGAAVDYGMALRAHSTLQRAADAAASAALSDIPLGTDAIAKKLRAHFSENVPKHYKKLDLPFTFDDDPPYISVRVQTKVQTSVLALMGFEHMPVRVEGIAQLNEPNKTITIPKTSDDPESEPEIAQDGTTLPPNAIAEAQRRLADYGIHLSPEQIQEMAEQAMREMNLGNLR